MLDSLGLVQIMKTIVLALLLLALGFVVSLLVSKHIGRLNKLEDRVSALEAKGIDAARDPETKPKNNV